MIVRMDTRQLMHVQVGVVRLTITQPRAGSRVTLRHGEVLTHPPYGKVRVRGEAWRVWGEREGDLLNPNRP